MELKSSDNITVRYHDIFDYKLTKEEAIKWRYKNQKNIVSGTKNISRLQREKYSKSKLQIAKKAANLISKIPTVKFIGITGALAMNNAGRDSDIDLMIITSKGHLWITRLLMLLMLLILHIPIRRAGRRDERNKLCLNMWMDESDLIWDKKDRNIYTAHEIAQIVPLVNKDMVYEKFLWKNRWILNYWPNAVDAKYIDRGISYIGKTKTQYTTYNILYTFLEKLAFKIQYLYMSKKIIREIVTPTRAIFHPNDWGKVVLNKLSS